MTSVEATD